MVAYQVEDDVWVIGQGFVQLPFAIEVEHGGLRGSGHGGGAVVGYVY